MSERPLISYVLTAYNIENFIEESVNCAFAQTYEPLEIVLSDDCSTDRTFEIMEKMAKEYTGPHKIVLNRNEKNLGITMHMNKAYLELANGEIIIAAHGDDISAPERAEVVADYLTSHLDCTQVSCSAIVCDKDMMPLSDHEQKNAFVDSERTYKFGSGAHLSIGFSGFRKKVMSYFGPLDSKCPTEDDAIGFRAIILGDIAFLPDKVIKYRKHEESNSNAEFFDRFPLDEIFNQNVRDMETAAKGGVITQQQLEEVSKSLYISKERRKVYRQYFRFRTTKTLVKLLFNKNVTFRSSISYLHEHFEYLKNK